MTISSTTYCTFLWILLVLIVGGAYLISRKKKKKGIQSIGIVLAILLIVVNKWIFPNVYVVAVCGKVSKEILLFPKTDESNIQLRLGKHCYLINRSNEPLNVETIVYGDINTYKQPEKMIDEIVPANKGKEYSVVMLDYFFEPQDESISTKQEGELKYRVSCNK